MTRLLERLDTIREQNEELRPHVDKSILWFLEQNDAKNKKIGVELFENRRHSDHGRHLEALRYIESIHDRILTHYEKMKGVDGSGPGMTEWMRDAK